MKLWHTANGLKVLTIKKHTDPVNSVCFSPDGTWLVSAGADRTGRFPTPGVIRIWHATPRYEAFQSRKQLGAELSIRVRPDGKRIVLGQEDKRVLQWDLVKGKEIIALTDHPQTVTSHSFSPDGNWLALGGFSPGIPAAEALAPPEQSPVFLKLKIDDQTETPTDENSNPPTLPPGPNLPPTRRRDDLHAGAIRDRGEVIVYEVRRGKRRFTYRDSSSTVSLVRFSPDGTRIVIASGDHIIKLIDMKTEMVVLTMKDHSDFITDICFSPNGQRLVSVSEDRSIKVWNSSDGRLLHTCKGHADEITSVSWHPNGKEIASSSGNWRNHGQIIWWDADTGREVGSLPIFRHHISSLSYSPDGKWMASAGGTMNHFCFHSKDGRRLDWGHYEQPVTVWDVQSRKAVVTFRGHKDLPTSVYFTPDSTKLISSGEDKTVRVWNLERTIRATSAPFK